MEKKILLQKLIQTSYCEAITKCTPLMPTGTPARKKKTLKNKKNKNSKDGSKSGEKIKIGEKILALKNTHQELNAKNE